MEGDRAVAMLVRREQWARCAHEGTSLLPDGGVELDWADPDGADGNGGCGPMAEAAGLAFDRWCRGYRSRPALGVVDTYAPYEAHTGSPCPGAMYRPRGLAVDRRQRLYIAEAGARSILVVDVPAGRALRRIDLGPARPIDLAASCGRVIALVQDPDALFVLDGRRGPRPGPALVAPRCREGIRPMRVATGPLVLWTGDGSGIVADPDGEVRLDVDGASDVEVTPSGVLVVARRPGQSFRRFIASGDQWLEIEPVGAPGYDGGAIAGMPDGRVAYTVATGYATTTGSVARHVASGSVVTYRFDSGTYRSRWGRMFLDACLPPNTSVRARFITSDLEDLGEPIEATAPARGAGLVPHRDRTPPLPTPAQLDAAPDLTSVFRRRTGREDPWPQIAPDDVFETYESPVAAPPGRYLWVELVLRGTDEVTPRVRAMRVEHPGHQLLNTLPNAWSRDEADADFLYRYLTPIDGVLHELDWRAAQRAILLDPRSTPDETLDWLASFAGLVLDRRWPESARRILIEEAYALFARRGTKAALVRLLEIYLNRAPAIVEQWQLRGLGGAVLGTEAGGPAAPVVGGSASATGTLGRFALGGVEPGTDAYGTSAHRFTVLIPGELNSEQRAVVSGLVRAHRPAHTVCDVCELGSGMRVGQRLRLALTAYVGPGTGWGPAVVGRTLVGGDGVVGTPAVGSRLGQTSVAGEVLVG